MSETLRDRMARAIGRCSTLDDCYDALDDVLTLMRDFDSSGLNNYASGSYSRLNIEAFVDDIIGDK
jgi:hypothetical protein